MVFYRLLYINFYITRAYNIKTWSPYVSSNKNVLYCIPIPHSLLVGLDTWIHHFVFLRYPCNSSWCKIDTWRKSLMIAWIPCAIHLGVFEPLGNDELIWKLVWSHVGLSRYFIFYVLYEASQSLQSVWKRLLPGRLAWHSMFLWTCSHCLHGIQSRYFVDWC